MIRLLLITALLLVTLVVGASATTTSPPDDCSWGISSTVVVDGVQSPPATEGCIP